MKKIFVFLLVLLFMATPCFGRKVTAVRDQIDALRDLFMAEEVEMAGYIWYVDSDQSHSGNGKSWDGALVTFQEAINLCEHDRGDVIYIAPGHAYNIISDGLIDLNKRGVTVKGMGNGDNRPTFTVSTATDADMHVTADDCVIENLIFVNGIDSLETMITITADNTTVRKCKFADGAATSGLGAITIGATDNDSDDCQIEYCYFFQPGLNNDHAIEILHGMYNVRIISNTAYGDYDEGIFLAAGGATDSNDLQFIRNTGTNLQASGYGIKVACTLNQVAFRDNKITVNIPEYALLYLVAVVDYLQVEGDVGSIADGNDVYPFSVVDDSLWAKVLSDDDPADASSYDNTTDSLEAIADAIADTNSDANTILVDLVLSHVFADTILDTIALDANTIDTATAAANVHLVDMNTLGVARDVELGDMNDTIELIETDITAANVHLVDMNTTIVAILADTNELQEGIVGSYIITQSVVESNDIPNNTQAAITSISVGKLLLVDISVSMDSTGWVGATTNIEFSADNAVYGSSGEDVIIADEVLGSFGASVTWTATTDGDTEWLPMYLEEGKKIYIHGDDNTQTGVGKGMVTLIFQRIDSNATITAVDLDTD